MPTILKRLQPPIVTAKPDRERMLETAEVKRCGVCWRIWPAEDFILEDGQERCPTCVDVRTATLKAEVTAEETAYAASRTLRPQVSQAPLNETFPGTIRKMTDVNGSRVYEAAPLRLTRGSSVTLNLLGRSFSSSDTITAPSGLTISVSSRTATQTTLGVTAAVGLAGGKYGLTFNSVDFNGVFQV